MNIPSSVDEFIAGHLTNVGGQKPVAVVDCDGTLIVGDIGEAMFYFQIERFLFRESPARLWPEHPHRQEIDSIFSSLTQSPPYEGLRDGRLVSLGNHLLGWYFGRLKAGETARACSDIVRLWSGFTRAEIDEVARDTVRLELSAPRSERLLGRYILPRGIRFIRETLEIVKRLHAAEFNIHVVSGSNVWSVREICRRLPVNPENVWGIDLVRSGGLMLPQVLYPVPVGDGKVDLLTARGLSRPAVVISDSVYDLPLFRACTGMKILISSEGPSGDFFRKAGFEPDTGWAVIDNPTSVI